MDHRSFLGIELPVIQAPMAGVQDEALAIAVSAAGGMGSLPCAMLSADDVLAKASTIKAATPQPFNLNFFCHSAPEPDDAGNRRWLRALTPYLSEFSVDPTCIPVEASRKPLDNAAVKLLEELAPPFVSFHFGLPEGRLLSRVKATGAKVLSSATTVEEALWLQQNGADAVIAQGVEAGGHRGMFLTDDLSTQLPTFELLAQVVRSVDVPVVAAGGIVNASDVARALSLGAIAAQVGTTYLLCNEALTSDLHRQALSVQQANAGDSQAVLTNVFSGRAARGIRNRAIDELGPLSEEAPAFPLAGNAMGLLRKAAEAQGKDDFSPLWCGTNTAGCLEIGAAQMTRMLAGVDS
ncbi:MAG: NAD(P)H-dependent flavin oxidoreductase [Halioglobus sp.]